MTEITSPPKTLMIGVGGASTPAVSATTAAAAAAAAKTTSTLVDKHRRAMNKHKAIINKARNSLTGSKDKGKGDMKGQLVRSSSAKAPPRAQLGCNDDGKLIPTRSSSSSFPRR